MPEPYDVITMGRIGVDLYPLRTGVPLARVDTFGKFLGGSPANVAVAAARLGRRTAVVTRTGQDPFGTYLHDQLREFGVDDRWVTPVAAYPTPVTFCEVFPPDDFPLYFYRQPKAPDLEIHASELDLAAIRAARVFWMTGTGLCAEPSRTATLAALRARDRSGITVFDLDWRPMFWEQSGEGAGPAAGPTGTPTGAPADDPTTGITAGAPAGANTGVTTGAPAGAATAATDGVTVGATTGPTTGAPAGTTGAPAGTAGAVSPSARYREALAHATVAVGNLDECEIATGEREPYAAARALIDAGVELAVVKRGPAGVLAVHRDGTVADVPPLPVDVVNGLGAGDAFGGSLCHGLLAGWETARTMRYANAAGAIVASRLACSSAMPFPHEVEAALAEGAVISRAPGAAR
ncbi:MULTISPECIES: 5-dehydro-2-deoxygluconokinase [unclassified Streptomyces]|uniref:5-dehydro-2-deoxygluconokinase n=1 Tax=unclassified Streptomyces TaxID=2593676 RepID=UPI00036BD427|nr:MULTISPECIES: 5-dehydro-2-deoxygluconokinase [unclassified Streptomyces]MYY00838.1 5-dehydro-2-deoxygluconokinase [Streptomyces sp. SID4913]